MHQTKSAQAIFARSASWTTIDTASGPAVMSTLALPLPIPSALVVNSGQISLGGIAGPAGSNLKCPSALLSEQAFL